ncbi:flagellar FlbD family protein [Fictibacillus macauensis ZFHKF-1]|uniref:Flagellar FlbD family protein n=1 Tax=Fictibacillus macauensis ZFHKF-1 TaxID=1196324 RepID=I8AI09_9BACL|nr:flagellar FlbD family protein [Fictibacillus macauensis]EIT85089.1 flagellar FlbD family protein [Fictibacillus macauensis ZFHKF-1]
MIELTKLNGETFTLHAVWIEHIQAFPDTTITLTSGKKFVVLEKPEEVKARVMTFYQTASPYSTCLHPQKEESK